MLVKLVDYKGKARWVNPLYVKALTPKGEADTEVEVSGWPIKLRIAVPPDELALTINAAMPDAAAFIAAQESEHHAAQRNSDATLGPGLGGLFS